jgi:SAM-dependent methyltransferase
MLEPLTASCGFLVAAAPWTCRRQAAGQCDWYHGSWQLLRLLDLVSNPSWHAEYFATRLPAVVADCGSIEVLVSGCADYSMYAHVYEALGDRARVTVLDQCATPLLATDWYRRYVGAGLAHTVLADATSYEADARFDLIVSDSFLPRFDSVSLRRLLAAWHRSLRPGGTAITTVRVHERNETPLAAAVHSRADSWRQIAEASKTWCDGESPIAHDELVVRVVEFAHRQERNAVYDTDELFRLFTEAGFAEVDITVKQIKGKQFARIAAGR